MACTGNVYMQPNNPFAEVESNELHLLALL